MSDEHDLSDRGTGRTRAYASPPSSERSDENAISLARVEATLAQARESASTWRWAGGLAASLALVIAGRACQLGEQAAADHGRVDRLEAIEGTRAERIERLVEAQGRQSAQLEQMDRVLIEIRADVRDLRADRRTSEERTSEERGR